MPTEAKRATVAELREDLAGSTALVTTEYRGLTVREIGEIRRALRPGGRIALMTSVRRELTLRPLKPLLERASGMRLFEGEEIVAALERRGFVGIHRRLSGMVQFVGGRLPT